MSDIPCLSVIIPHLNEPDDLRRCLSALDAQRIDGIAFEIIVVDNGSRIPPAFAVRQVPGVRLETERTPGPGPARNRGASVARAELLAFIDADCLAGPGWVRAIVEFMEANPGVDFVGGDIRVRPVEPGHMTAVEAYESVYSYQTRRYIERDGYAATGNMAVRAGVFRAVGPFGPVGTMEDTEWGQRATAAGYRRAYLAEARVDTPSCRSFTELARRWDRHVAHEFGRMAQTRTGMFKWSLKAAVIAVSPPAEIVRVARSDRLSNPRERCLALACVTRARLYRARRMFGLALGGDATPMVDMWNREQG